MREAVLQRRIQKALRDRGWWVRKLHGSQYQAGLPDLVAVKDGRTIWIEVKLPGKKLSPLQEASFDELYRAGGQVYVTTSVEFVLEAVGAA